MRIQTVPLALAGLLLSNYALAHRAHDHGSAELDVVIDGSKVRIELEGPADNFFGFEHLPKDDAEKKIIADVMQLLRTNPLKLFGLPAAADCSLVKAEVDADQEDAMLARKDGKQPTAKDHAEVEAEWDFTCKNSPAGGTLVLAEFFKSFPKVANVKLQLVVGDKQSGAKLTPKDTSISL